ncbi:MAG: leucine-rich repeat domain-containing protein [Bacteroidales bacterium]|nr:leucine-rich repeat domain-containing protein [Bacteroidales bacterium]
MTHFTNPQRLLALLAALLLSAGTAYAADFSAMCSTGQTLYYIIIDATNHEVELTYPAISNWDGFEKPTGNITLPSQVSYNGIVYTVTKIGNSAFIDCTGLTGSLTIPNSVTEIGNYAFYNCSGFTGSLTIPNSVTEIGNYAFYNCSGFTGSLTIPNSVTTIGQSVFSKCSGFTGSLTLGNALTTIPFGAFDECSGFTGTLTIPNTVTMIGNYAFYNCSGFTGTLTIPNSVTTIGNYAFYNCSGFTGTLTIPSGLTQMGLGAFQNCTGFTQVNYNATNCSDVAYSTTTGTFNGCGGTLTIGDNVERIPNNMFLKSSFTGPLTIPDSVTEIGEFAFYDCHGFTGPLTLSNTLTKIEMAAFAYCNFTGPLTIPNSVTIIEDKAFYGTAGFTGMLTIGSSVGEIGYQAFYLINHSITAITVLAETPPELENHEVFFFHKLPVYVPRASLSSYLEDEGWSSQFSIITYAVTVNANVMPSNGGTVSGQGITGYGQELTMTATPSTNYLFLHWKKDGEVVSCNASYTFTPEDDTDLEAVFMGIPFNTKMIGQGETTSEELPSNTNYAYSMTQQIYTAEEMGMSRNITSISFFNAGPTITRYFDIYMTHTSKTSFSSDTDWITVDASKRVYSGTVVLKQGVWTTIPLDQSFSYQNTYSGGTSLALIVDDNMGDYDYNMECRTFPTQSYQALYVRKDGTNLNPLNPSSYTGARLMEKNQIMFNRNTYQVNASAFIESAGTVTGVGQYGQNDFCRLKAIPNEGFVFMDWTDASGTVVSTDAEYVFLVEEDVNLTATFLPEDDYCNITFDLYDSYGDGWNGNYLVADLGFYGLTRRFAVPESLDEASFALPVLQGSLVTLSWISGSYVSDCSFELSYTEGDLIYESIDLGVGYSYIFEVDCGLGMATQTLELSAGWNWVSLNVEITMNDLKAAIVAANPGVSPVIKSKGNGQTSFNGAVWVGALKTLDLSQMYEIKVANACTVNLEGARTNPADHPATIKNGVNWIAYPLNEEMTVSAAFEGFPATGDNVKSKDGGQATWNGVMWLGALKRLTPGVGYLYISKAAGDKTFTFPTNK